jgi:hypothetical protein
MTMKTKTLICFGAVLCIAAVEVVKRPFELPEAKVTIKAVDEAGRPVAGASARLGFKERTTQPNTPFKDVMLQGVTDAAGLFGGQGGSDTVVGADLKKDGYYLSGVPIPIFTDTDKILNRFLPWDATYVSVLRPILKPIPMYAHKIGVVIPEVGTPCGYDLMEADWVAPQGRGKTADFLVTVTNLQYSNANDSDVTAVLSFPNDGDGIQAVQLPKEFSTSVFKWPREAPATGYQPKFETHRLWFNPPPTNPAPGRHITTATGKETYFFRVRTVKRGNEIISALYGKISAGIPVGPGDGKKAVIGFTYYLNPTSLDRNMEFDLTKNLFKNLKDSEKPRDP